MKHSSICIVCGDHNLEKTTTIISDTLARTWKLSAQQRHQFDERESNFCLTCKSSTRTRALATAIMNKITYPGVTTFDQWTKHAAAARLRIAEINSCGCLHTYLKNVPTLSYSEYVTANGIVKFLRKLKGVPHENTESLSYPDTSFDLVIHSDVLEHVANPHKALLECKRILTAHGICIFTIPVIMQRKTIQPIAGKPSFHGSDNRGDYLVRWEFGADFIRNEYCRVELSQPSEQMYVLSLRK